MSPEVEGVEEVVGTGIVSAKGYGAESYHSSIAAWDGRGGPVFDATLSAEVLPKGGRTAEWTRLSLSNSWVEEKCKYLQVVYIVVQSRPSVQGR
jgi:hypothetical protein